MIKLMIKLGLHTGITAMGSSTKPQQKTECRIPTVLLTLLGAIAFIWQMSAVLGVAPSFPH